MIANKEGRRTFFQTPVKKSRKCTVTDVDELNKLVIRGAVCNVFKMKSTKFIRLTSRAVVGVLKN